MQPACRHTRRPLPPTHCILPSRCGPLPACRPRFTRYLALVLCPNVALCQQVAAAVNALRGPAAADGSSQQQQQQQLVSAAVINSSNPPPFETPDVVVATPAGLLNIIDDAGGAYGWLWSEEGMQVGECGWLAGACGGGGTCGVGGTCEGGG